MTDDDLRKTYERMYGPFTHMGPEDAAIWVRFLVRGGNIHAPFYYDLRVGDGVQMPPDASDRSLRIAAALTTKRIDVLWYEQLTPVICELKKYAGATAIGQLILYRQLFAYSFPNQPPARTVLITDRLQPDMITSLTENDIQYIEVGL